MRLVKDSGSHDESRSLVTAALVLKNMLGQFPNTKRV